MVRTSAASRDVCCKGVEAGAKLSREGWRRPVDSAHQYPETSPKLHEVYSVPANTISSSRRIYSLARNVFAGGLVKLGCEVSKRCDDTTIGAREGSRSTRRFVLQHGTQTVFPNLE
jgi:hypothetical protein